MSSSCCPCKDVVWLPEHRAWHVRDPAQVVACLEAAEALRVRPPDEPVPLHLQGTLLGWQFALWLRQRDDDARRPVRHTVEQAVATLSEAVVHEHALRQAQLARTGGWDHWVWLTITSTVASLLGLSLSDLEAQRQLGQRLQAMARGLAGHDMVLADTACHMLLEDLSGGESPLQEALRGHAPADGTPLPNVYGANRLALVWQSYEAGAALLGSALSLLIEQPALRHRAGWHDGLAALVNDGAVIFNTRRYASSPMAVGAAQLQVGDAVLLDLAGGNGFGHGTHACPGSRLAMLIAETAIVALLQEDVIWPVVQEITVLPNACIPRFSPVKESR